MKRIISTILTISMMFTMAPAFASDVDTADVNNIVQLFSVGDGEVVYASSADKLDVIKADFSSLKAGTYTTSYSGDNYKIEVRDPDYSSFTKNDDGSITLTQKAGAADQERVNFLFNGISENGKSALEYKARFDVLSTKWTRFEVNSGASSLFINGGKFGLNNTPPGGKADLPNLTDALTANVWYTIKYVFDNDAKTYTLDILDESGKSIVVNTTEKWTYRYPKNLAGSLSITTAQGKPSVESVISIKDAVIYPIKEVVDFDVIGPETVVAGDNTFRMEYNNTTSDEVDFDAFLVAYDENGIVVGSDIKSGTIQTGSDTIELMFDAVVADSYKVFVTGNNGASLCVRGSREGSTTPVDFVSANETDGKISVKVAKDSAYDAAIIRVYDDAENLVGIKEQKITNDAIVFAVNEYNKEYKVDVTLSDAAGNAAYGKTYVSVWNPAIVQDFNTDPEAAFAAHMDALDKAYGGDFASIYEENSSYINDYIRERDDYTSVYDVIDTVLSLEGFLTVITAESEGEFADAIETNADSLGITIDDVYSNNKEVIIATLFAIKDDFILPDDFVVAYNDVYITSEFNMAAAISYGRLFERYYNVLGITLDNVYYNGEATINELIYEYKLASDDGRFADTAAVAKAYRTAKDNATDAVGYANVAISPLQKPITTVNFEANSAKWSTTVNANSSADVVSLEGNNVMKLTQPAGDEDGVMFAVNDQIEDIDTLNIKERIMFESLDTGYTFLRTRAAYLYIENNKWGINYGSSVMVTTGTIELVETNVWYNINFDFDMASKTFDVIITKDDGTVVFQDYSCAFRGNDINSMCIQTPHKDDRDGVVNTTTVDTVIYVDDIVIAAKPEAAVYYSAKASENVIAGSNGIAVTAQNLTGTDRNINVYVPVYVDGVLYAVANEQAYIADGTEAEVLITYEIGEGVDVSKVTYQVIVADSLDGTNHSIVSAVASGELSVEASADFEAEVINVSTVNTFDNGTIIVLKPGATISSADMSDILYYAEGNTAAVKVADGISGDLKVYAVAQNADGVVTVDSTEVYYPGNGMAEKLVDAFNDATPQTIASVVAEYITVINSIEEGINSFYVANAVAVDATLVANKPYTSTTQIINTIKSVKTLAALKAAENETAFEKVFVEFADMFDVKLDSIYTNNKTEYIAKLFAAKDTFNTYEDVMAAYDAIYMIYDINTATDETVGAKLAKYATALGIALDDVYTSKQLYIDRLVAANVPFADAAAIVSAYNNAYAKAEAIEGDFVKTVVSMSEAQIASDIVDFENEDIISASSNESYSSKDGLFTISQGTNAVGMGEYFIEQDSTGNKYVRLTAPAQTKRAAQLYLPNNNYGSNVHISTKFKANKLSNWVLFYVGNNASCLNLQGGVFKENWGQNKAPTINSKTISTGVWYTITWDMDFQAHKYDLYIVNSADPNDVIVDQKDIPFRDNKQETQLTFATSSENSTESDIEFDDIKRIAVPESGFYYSVEATKSLLPGNNKFELSFTNADSQSKPTNVYVPVYVNGALTEVKRIHSAVIDAGSSFVDTVDVDIEPSLFNKGTVGYDVLIVASLDGTNYGIASKVVLPRTTTPAIPVVDYTSRTIKVSGTTTYDNMSILVTGPVADGRDYDIQAAKTDSSVIAYYAPAKLTTISTATDGATQEKIITSSFAADISVPDKFVNGDYNIYLVSQNKAGEVQTSYAYTYYAGSDMLDDMLADFNAIGESNVEATVNKYMEVLEGVAGDAATFYANNKAAVNTALLAEDSFADVGEINAVIFSIYAIDKLDTASDVATFRATFEYYANVFGINTATSEYAEGAAEINQRLFADKANLTIDNISGKYATALMLSEFNNAVRGEVDAVLTKYSTKLGLSVSSATYNTYKDYIAKAIAADGVVFNSAADIVSAYNNGITDGQNNGVGAPQPAGPTGTTGGGGGGGGAISANVAQPYVEPETSLDGTTSSAAFVDLDTVPWAVEAITELKRIGVISGVSDTQFAPDRAVTREEFAKMIVNAFSISGEGKTFTDVPATAWYAPYVTALASSGIVNGVTDSTFGVGTKITRQDAAVILDRTSAKVGIEYKFDTSALNIFSDYMADYARISIYRLYQNGVINGTSATTFCATDTLTRAQAAKMIYGLMQLK